MPKQKAAGATIRLRDRDEQMIAEIAEKHQSDTGEFKRANVLKALREAVDRTRKQCAEIVERELTPDGCGGTLRKRVAAALLGPMPDANAPAPPEPDHIASAGKMIPAVLAPGDLGGYVNANPAPADWPTCTFCGAAVSPITRQCESCGEKLLKEKP